MVKPLFEAKTNTFKVEKFSRLINCLKALAIGYLDKHRIKSARVKK